VTFWRHKRAGRWFVWLALFLVLVAQSAAFESANQQHHSEDHCCLLCHVGPLPFLNTSVSALAMPVFCMVWLESAPDFIPTHEVLLAASSSRGPPA
jgi:hypothetical protein